MKRYSFERFSYLSLHKPVDKRGLPVSIFAVRFERAVSSGLAGFFCHTPFAYVQEFLIHEASFAE